MRICRWSIILLSCLLLMGCASLLDREYRVVELHSSKFREDDAEDILRAESYQDIVNDLLLLVGEYQQKATLRLYSEDSEATVASELERAAAEVQQDTPLGAYAVEYITTESSRERGYYEIYVRIGYNRTRDQMQAIVNATSTAALEPLLSAAMESGRKSLAVRIGYWNAGDEEKVSDAMLRVEEEWAMKDSQIWTASYYPSAGNVGLIEFRLEPAPKKPTVSSKPEKPVEPEKPAQPETLPEQPSETELPIEGGQGVPAEGEQPAEGQMPAEGEQPVEGQMPAEGEQSSQGGETGISGGEEGNTPAVEAADTPAVIDSTISEEKIEKS